MQQMSESDRRAELQAEADLYNFELAMARDYAAAHGFPKPNSPGWDFLMHGCEHRNYYNNLLCGWPPVGDTDGKRTCLKHSRGDTVPRGPGHEAL